MSDFQLERLLWVFRHWPGPLRPRVALTEGDSSRLPYLIGVTSLVAAWSLETALWSSGIKPLWLFRWFLHSPVGWGFLSLLILWNGWVLDQHLERLPPRSVAGWLRALRTVAASLPLLGLWMIPAWRRFSAWKRASRREPQLDLSAPGVDAATVWVPWERLRHRVVFSPLGLLFWMIACQFLAAAILVSWLVDAGRWSPGRAWASVACCCVLHLSALAGFLQLVPSDRRRLQPSRRMSLVVSLFALLLPAPFSFLGFVGISTVSDSWDLTFTQHFYAQRGNASQRWIPSQQTRRRWRRWIDGQESESRRALGESANRRLSFYRLKILLLFFDAGLLGWLLAVFRSPALSMGSSSVWLLVVLLPAGLGLLLEIVSPVSLITSSRSFRGFLVRHSYGAFLMAIPFVFGAGLLMGSSLGLGDTRSLALLLNAIGLLSVLTSMLIVVSFAVRTMVAGGRSGSLGNSGLLFLAWVVLFMSLYILGTVASTSDQATLEIATALRWAFWLSPLCHLALWLLLGDWLLHPLPLLLRRLPRQVPWPRRILPAFLSLTALAPGGGLFVPFWIFARKKWWPAYTGVVDTDG
jgi:hypothetical protein